MKELYATAFGEETGRGIVTAQADVSEASQLREALAEALGATRTARVTGQNSRRDTPGRQAVELIGPC